MADRFYFLVTPDAAQFPNGLTDAAGVQKFFIKFGDGAHGDRYATHNPCYQIASNNRIPGSGTVGIPGSTAPGVRIAKFIEVQLLGNAAGGLHLTQVGNREWYIIRPGPGGIAVLRNWLTTFLAAFPNLNFDGTHVLTSDQVTWNWVLATRAAMTAQGFH